MAAQAGRQGGKTPTRGGDKTAAHCGGSPQGPSQELWLPVHAHGWLRLPHCRWHPAFAPALRQYQWRSDPIHGCALYRHLGRYRYRTGGGGHANVLELFRSTHHHGSHIRRWAWHHDQRHLVPHHHWPAYHSGQPTADEGEPGRPPVGRLDTAHPEDRACGSVHTVDRLSYPTPKFDGRVPTVHRPVAVGFPRHLRLQQRGVRHISGLSEPGRLLEGLHLPGPL